MRDRPYPSGSESPRPYSEVRAENPDFHRRFVLLTEAQQIEEEARASGGDPRLQCEAEVIRDALYHQAEVGNDQPDVPYVGLRIRSLA